MNCLYIITICFMVLVNTLNAKNLQARSECACNIGNQNEIDPIIPCFNNPSESTKKGCVTLEDIQGMNNQTCLALQPWSSIQRFMSECTEVKTQQLHSQWIVRSICPNLNKDQTEISKKIAEKCVDFSDNKCLCENNLYKYKELYSCFHQNDTTSSYDYCKEKGWVIDSSAIFNINYQILPIGILALFATFFL